MSSVRPALKPQIPKIVTAWDAATGRTVYRDAAGQWRYRPEQAEILTGDAADSALDAAKGDQKRANDPYLMQVDAGGKPDGREILRETLRAQGPSVHPHLGRQADNN